MPEPHRCLTILLRLGGSVMLLAFGAMLLPTPWMAASHRALGLGEFPASPLVEYLTRSISALYGVHGGLLLVVARDVRGHASIVRYLGWMNVLFGALIVGIDVYAGLPWLWVVAEGPPVTAFGLIVVALLRASERT